MYAAVEPARVRRRCALSQPRHSPATTLQPYSLHRQEFRKRVGEERRRSQERAMIQLRTGLCALAFGAAVATGASVAANATCQLQSPGGNIKRVVHIVFDNVHLRRDIPNVPSDLEQMP